MCPISGLVQFLIIIVTLLLICHSVVVHALKITFEPKAPTVQMYHSIAVNYSITDFEPGESYQLYVQDPNVAFIEKPLYLRNDIPPGGSFNITGNFLGKTEIFCETVGGRKKAEGKLDVTVIREKRTIDTIFTASVATLVSIIYINFGCALNWSNMVQTLKKPIGPVIGLFGQFIIMPLLSFGLGKLLFPDNTAMQLGMFFTGVSPAGGASNIWTVVLDGNIDLSVTMTTLSTLAAFGMMPLWLFTLGKVIFDQGDIQVPYNHIFTYAIGLIVPLAIGFLISRYLKKVAHFLVKILKGFSSLLLVFIIVFAIVTNVYLFKLFSWQIIIAGMGLPYLGFLLAYVLATVLRQPAPDTLAIAIETGIQNTGIAIFLLRFSLPQPQADLTTIAPVAVAMMTPLPLLCIFLYKKIKARISPTHKKLNGVKEATTEVDVEKRVDKNCNAENHDSLISTISQH